MSAQEIRAFRNIATKLVKTEERGKLMGNLKNARVGLREIEEFVLKEENKLRGTEGKNYKLRRELVAKAMDLKIKDNWKTGVGLRKARNRLKGKIEEILGPGSRKYRWLLKSVGENCAKTREKLKKKYMKKLEFLKGKYGRNDDPLNELNRMDRKKYGSTSIPRRLQYEEG